MGRLIPIFILTFLSTGVFAQSIIGAWESSTTTENGDVLRNILILSDGYQVYTVFKPATGEIVHSNGGTWSLEGDMMTEKVEFHTDDPERIGSEVSFKVIITDESIEIAGTDMKLSRIDSGDHGALAGAWLMTGRVKEGITQHRDTTRPWKTMKILSGTRFQWIAYNTETKQFSGTGGGTYTIKDGEYTENIEFFSKDPSRTGMSLTFDYKLIDGDWHHSGLSSKGKPVNEIWSIRKK